MIRRATDDDIPALLALASEAGMALREGGIMQWDNTYPNSAIFERDLSREQLYVLDVQPAMSRSTSEIAGCIVVSWVSDEEYDQVQWLIPSSTNSYIHRLVIHPLHQRRGHASLLMEFAEKISREKGCESIRLDAFSQNLSALRMYEKLGFRRLEELFFSHCPSKEPFYCYEKVLL